MHVRDMVYLRNILHRGYQKQKVILSSNYSMYLCMYYVAVISYIESHFYICSSIGGATLIFLPIGNILIAIFPFKVLYV